jgi:hypothetical protein
MERWRWVGFRLEEDRRSENGDGRWEIGDAGWEVRRSWELAAGS